MGELPIPLQSLEERYPENIKKFSDIGTLLDEISKMEKYHP
jgi:hypothetical protein